MSENDNGADGEQNREAQHESLAEYEHKVATLFTQQMKKMQEQGDAAKKHQDAVKIANSAQADNRLKKDLKKPFRAWLEVKHEFESAHGDLSKDEQKSGLTWMQRAQAISKAIKTVDNGSKSYSVKPSERATDYMNWLTNEVKKLIDELKPVEAKETPKAEETHKAKEIPKPSAWDDSSEP